MKRLYACAPAPASRQGGFTMIEVLVALTIVAVALATSIRAVGSLANTAGALHQRLLAGWSADSVLVDLRLAHRWPELGTTRFECSQGDLLLICTQTVSNTPNPLFRRVEITVTHDEETARLAQLVTVVANESSRPL
jgi:general secretion pathway protein I